MGIASGSHDQRTFRHYAKMGADGSVVAIVAVAEGSPAPIDGEHSLYVDVTDVHPYDFRGVSIAMPAAPAHSPQLATDRDSREQYHHQIRALLKAANRVRHG